LAGRPFTPLQYANAVSIGIAVIMFKRGLLNVLELLDPTVPTSPILHLFTSNQTPTSDELAAARNVLITARRQREALFTGVRGAPASNKDSVWDRRQRKIRVLDDFIQRLESRITPSPILQLPVELLQEIFMVVTDMLNAEKYDKIWIQKRIWFPPNLWAISRVCQLWRRVAVSTPYLWRNLPEVHLSAISWRRQGRSLALLQMLLHRSQGCTIEVTIRSYLRHRPCLSHSAIKLLIEQSNRWSYLAIMDEDGAGVIDELLSVEGRFPSLRTLHINGMPHQWPSLAGCSFLEAAPSLEYVSIDNVPINFGSSAFRIWEHADEGGNAVYDALTELCLSPMGRGHMFLRTLSLPNLRRLEFDSGYDTSHWFIDHLVVPSLNRLTLKSSFRDDDLCSMASNIIHRSNSSSIYELSISQINRPTALATLLSATPFLRYLNICLPYQDDILKLSKQHHGEFTLVPFLSSCIFHAYGNLHNAEAIKPLDAMASSRFASFIPMPSNPALNSTSAPSYPEGVTIEFGWSTLVPSVSSIQCVLQDWPESEKSRILEAENARINSILSDLESAHERVPKLRLKRGQAAELDAILRHILETKIDAIGDILVSSISRYLWTLNRYIY